MLVALLGLVAATNAHPPALCDSSITRTGVTVLRPATVRSVSVRTEGPSALPFGGWLSPLRRTTSPTVVRRQVLVGPGEALDSLRIAETLRRLRAQRLYSDVYLQSARCVGADSIDLMVVTRDAWTLRPVARVVPPSTVSLGMEDRNLLGSGRLLAVSNDQTQRGHGGSASFVDPWLFGSDMVLGVRFADIAGNHLLRAYLRHDELGAFDPWRFEASMIRQTYSDSRAAERPLTMFGGSIDVGHLIGDARTSITLPYAGVELDSAQVIAIRQGDGGVPAEHRRRFVGVDLGLLHRAVRYDTVSWFVPERGFLDVPAGAEGDLLISPGWDRAQRRRAARFDAWLGRMWIPGRGTLAFADAWTSGYIGDVRPNQIDRLAFGAYHEASRGYVGARFLFEQCLLLDPDLRGLSLATIANDPSLSAVPQAFRLADRAVMGSMERAFHLRAIGRASTLDVAPFAAGSMRWDAPTSGSDRFAVGVVGLRLRMLSTNGAISSTRIDLAYPVVASGGTVVRRPLLSVSVAPLFESARQRDGRRR